MKPNGTLRALKIIRDNYIVYPSHFAELMWPESPALMRSYRAGHGKTNVVGRGLNRSAGGFLGKLRKRGLIGFDVAYCLTLEGRAALASAGVQDE